LKPTFSHGRLPLLEVFTRVSRRRPCPICGKADWCLVDRSDPPNSAVCERTPSENRWGDAGWFHRLGTSAAPVYYRRRTAVVSSAPAPDLSAFAQRYSAAVDAGKLTAFAASLGLTADSLRRLAVGWTGRAWSFPMTARGRVCGLRLRYPDGTKYSLRGGKEGLFVPAGLVGSASRLFIAEGPTDTAALLDLGFDAIGRPSCTGGVRHILDFVAAASWSSAVIVADTDAPGQAGARSLASALGVRCRDVRVIAPPDPFKDVRAWKQGGATGSEVEAAVEAAAPCKVSLQIRKGGSWTG
jgi:hypothetical protein